MTAPAMPSDGERLWSLFVESRSAICMSSPLDSDEPNIYAREALARVVATERAAARLEAVGDAAKILVERAACLQLAHGSRVAEGNTPSAGRLAFAITELLAIERTVRSLSAPPQKTQEEMTDG